LRIGIDAIIQLIGEHMRRLVETFLATSAVLFLASCGSSSSSPSTPSSPGTAANIVITIQSQNGNMSFSPASASVKIGQTVAWKNADTITHTATQDNGSFDTGAVAPGTTSAPIQFSSAGSLPYHCSIHPSMVATLTVTQ
jgi:plastocyanin